MAFTDRIDRWLGVCERLFLVLANACLAVMLLINAVQITSRAILDKGIAPVFPWSVVLLVWMTFLGFFVLYRRRRDITVDFIVDRIGPSARLATRLLVNAIILVIMGVMLWHAPQIIESQEGMIELVGLQRRALSIPLFVSCALIAVNAILDTRYAFQGIAERQPTSIG